MINVLSACLWQQLVSVGLFFWFNGTMCLFFCVTVTPSSLLILKHPCLTFSVPPQHLERFFRAVCSGLRGSCLPPTQLPSWVDRGLLAPLLLSLWSVLWPVCLTHKALTHLFCHVNRQGVDKITKHLTTKQSCFPCLLQCHLQEYNFLYF